MNLQKKINTFFHLNWPWVYRFLKKYAFIYSTYGISKLRGRKFWNIDIDGAVIKLSFVHPYHHLIARHLHKGDHEVQLLKMWKNNRVGGGKKGAVILDIGGYNGIFGLISAHTNPNAEVFIFEPDPTNYQQIVVNVSLNKLTNITVLQMAVSDKKGTVQFRDHKGGTGGNISEKGEFATLEVPCTTVDEWAHKYNKIPTLIKWDIEGAEYRGLVGMQNLFAKTKNIQMLLEVHQLFLERFGNTEKEIADLLSQHKYAALWLDQNKYTTHYWVYQPQT